MSSSQPQQDLPLTQPPPLSPRQDTQMEPEVVPEQPLFKAKSKPKKAKAADGTKAKKQTGGSAASAGAGKKQRASVKAAAAKPVTKPLKRASKPTSDDAKKKKPRKEAAEAKSPSPKKKIKEAPGAPQKKRKPAKAAAEGETTAATDPKSSSAAAQSEGAKLNAVIDILLELANARLRAGHQSSSALENGAASAEHATIAGGAATTEVRHPKLPHHEGHVTGL